MHNGPPPGISITQREREVLLLVAEGLSDQQIAAHLHISPKTVNYHVENLKKQFGVGSRIQVVVIALRRRIID